MVTTEPLESALQSLFELFPGDPLSKKNKIEHVPAYLRNGGIDKLGTSVRLVEHLLENGASTYSQLKYIFGEQTGHIARQWQLAPYMFQVINFDRGLYSVDNRERGREYVERANRVLNAWKSDAS